MAPKHPTDDDRHRMEHGEGFSTAELSKRRQLQTDGRQIQPEITNEHGENYRKGHGRRGGPRGV